MHLLAPLRMLLAAVEWALLLSDLAALFGC